MKSKWWRINTASQPRTSQGWAWDYLRNRLGNIPELLESSENLPKITTFADLKEGELFIRFPIFRVEDDKLVFKNTELHRKIQTVRYKDGSNSYCAAMKMVVGSFHKIPDNEPVVVIR